MKRARVPPQLAPTPRMTLWVPGLVSAVLCGLWLILWIALA